MALGKTEQALVAKMTKDKRRRVEVEEGRWQRPNGWRGRFYGARELAAAERLVERGLAREVSRKKFYGRDSYGTKLVIELAQT